MPVTVNLEPLHKFRREVESGLQGQGSSAVKRALRQWGEVYRSFVRLRFSRFSRGGGNWPSLAPSTIRRKLNKSKGKKSKKITIRRRGESKTTTRNTGIGKVAILIDDSLLINALDPTFQPGKGAIQQHIPFGIRVGFGGPAKHEKSNRTIAAIARMHQTGGPNLPKREIIVDPDQRTVNKMAALMEKALGDTWGKATAG